MKGSPQSQDGNGVAMIQVSSTKQNIKDVSDLETCTDYFKLPGRSCESLNFPAEKNLATSQKYLG